MSTNTPPWIHHSWIDVGNTFLCFPRKNNPGPSQVFLSPFSLPATEHSAAIWKHNPLCNNFINRSKHGGLLHASGGAFRARPTCQTRTYRCFCRDIILDVGGQHTRQQNLPWFLPFEAREVVQRRFGVKKKQACFKGKYFGFPRLAASIHQLCTCSDMRLIFCNGSITPCAFQKCMVGCWVFSGLKDKPLSTRWYIFEKKYLKSRLTTAAMCTCRFGFFLKATKLILIVLHSFAIGCMLCIITVACFHL